jgi:hypothetical protein
MRTSSPIIGIVRIKKSLGINIVLGDLGSQNTVIDLQTLYLVLEEDLGSDLTFSHQQLYSIVGVYV